MAEGALGVAAGVPGPLGLAAGGGIGASISGRPGVAPWGVRGSSPAIRSCGSLGLARGAAPGGASASHASASRRHCSGSSSASARPMAVSICRAIDSLSGVTLLPSPRQARRKPSSSSSGVTSNEAITRPGARAARLCRPAARSPAPPLAPSSSALPMVAPCHGPARVPGSSSPYCSWTACPAARPFDTIRTFARLRSGGRAPPGAGAATAHDAVTPIRAGRIRRFAREPLR